MDSSFSSQKRKTAFKKKNLQIPTTNSSIKLPGEISPCFQSRWVLDPSLCLFLPLCHLKRREWFPPCPTAPSRTSLSTSQPATFNVFSSACSLWPWEMASLDFPPAAVHFLLLMPGKSCLQKPIKQWICPPVPLAGLQNCEAAGVV